MGNNKEPAIKSEGELITPEEMQKAIDDMRIFMARRFDEISMEINATAQQIDMNESDLQSRFNEILQSLGTITHHSKAMTAANTGTDLESVIKETENAANEILDAADRIADRIAMDQNLDNPEKREKAIAEIRKDVEIILMACSFQDLTGQRIRKAVEKITDINENISNTLDQIGIRVDVDQEKLDEIITEDHASSQDDIDALFGDNND